MNRKCSKNFLSQQIAQNISTTFDCLKPDYSYYLILEYVHKLESTSSNQRTSGVFTKEVFYFKTMSKSKLFATIYKNCD